MNKPVIITQHAYARAKERLRWNDKVLDKMAQKAFDNGICHADTKGNLKKWLTMLWHKHRNSNNPRVYGQNVFFFNETTLITMYQLPNHLRHLARIDKQVNNKSTYNENECTKEEGGSSELPSVLH